MDAFFLEKIGFRGAALESSTVEDLIDQGVLDRPLDGNHGEIHPKASDYVENGIPFVMATDLKNGRVDLTGCYKIPENIANDLRKGFAKTGDVLLSHKATLGRVARVGEIDHDFIVLTPQTTYYRVLKPNALDPDYLVQYFRSQYFQDLFKLWGGSGSTRAYLGITAQKKLPIVSPLVTTQRKIAAILTAYDDLIENNRQRIALLEKMAEEIYREWFVRLRFPGHEHTPVHKGVPEGWQRRSVSKLGQFLNGYPFKPSEHFDDGHPIIKIKELNNGVTEDTPRHDRDLLKTRYHIDDGHIIFSWSGSLVVRIWDEGEAVLNQHLFKVVPYALQERPFVYFSLKQAIPAFSSLTTGATMQHIRKGELDVVTVLAPSEDVMKRFCETTEPMLRQQITLTLQNRTLTKTRNLLLNRLISGKLRVDDLDIQFPPSMREAQDTLTDLARRNTSQGRGDGSRESLHER